MKNSVQRGVIFGWLKHAVIIPTGIILTPFVLSKIGKDMYGVWGFLNCFVNYYALMCLGFGATISRYTSRYYTQKDFKKLNDTASLIFFVYLLMGCAAFGICALAAWIAPTLTDWSPVTTPEIRATILIMGVNIFVSILGGVFGGVLMGIQRYDLERGTHIVATIFRFVITLWMLQRNWGLPLLAFFNLALTLVEVGGHTWFAFRNLPELSIRWKHVNRETFNECYSFSGFALLDDIAHRLIYMTDNIVIGLSIGFGAIVPFQVASRIANDSKIPIRQIGQVFLSKAGELEAESRVDQIRGLVLQGTGLALMLMTGILTGVWFFGDTLANTWMRSASEWLPVDTADAHLLMIVLVGAQVIAVPISIIRSTLMGMGRAKVPAMIYALEAVCNLTLSLILIQRFGVFGVALGTLIPIVIFELTLLLPYACREMRITAKELFSECVFRQIFPLGALLAYCMVVHPLVGNQTGWLLLLAIAGAGGCVLGAVWFAVARLTGRSLLPSSRRLGPVPATTFKNENDSPRAMRVLVITNLFPNRQEPGRAVFNGQQFAALREHCDYTVVAPLPLFRFSRKQVPKRDTINGVQVLHPRYIVIPKILRSLHGLSMFIGMFRQVRRELRRNPADVILATWAYPDCFAAALIAKCFGLPLVTKVHGTDCNYGLKFYLRRKMIRFAMRSAETVVSVSSQLKDKLVGIGVPDKQITVLLNGVDDKRFFPADPVLAKAQLGLNGDKRHVLFVGNMVRVKSIDTLLHALERLPDNIVLHLLGDGPLQGSLKVLAESLNLQDRVHFHGRLPHDDLPVWFNAADVFCLPSLNEGCPNVVVEAIACGTPVVASNVGAIPDLINAPERGRFVTAGDVAAFAAALEEVLDRETTISENISADLSWRQNALQLYETLAAAAGLDPHNTKQSTKPIDTSSSAAAAQV